MAAARRYGSTGAGNFSPLAVLTLEPVIFIKASLLHLLSQGICSHSYCSVWQGILLDRVISFVISHLATLLGFGFLVFTFV